MNKRPSRIIISFCLMILLFISGCNTVSDVSSSAPDTVSNEEISHIDSDLSGSSEALSSTVSDKASSGKASSGKVLSEKSQRQSSKPSSSKTPSIASSEPSLPTDRTPWSQKKFYLSTFRAVALSKLPEVYEKSMAAHKEAGFNLAENAILSTEDMFNAVEACEKVGLECMAQDISTFSGMGSKYPINNDDMLLDMILQLCGYKSLMGYFIWDEPHEENFSKNRYVKDFFKDKDPGRLAYSLIFPSYGTYTWSSNHANWANDSYKKYVDKYLSTVDPEVISFDYYPFRSGSVSLNENYLWRDLGYLRKKAIELKKPLWFYFQASGMVPNTELTNPQLRVQMFSALAYGVTGLSYYTSLGLIVDEEGNKLPRFNEIKSLNKEVRNLGDYLFSKTSDKLYHTGVSPDKLVGYFVDDLASSDLILSAPEGLVIGVFKDSTQAKSLVVVNKDFTKTLYGQLKLKGMKNVKRFNKSTKEITQISSATDTLNLQIPAGDCEIFIIQ